MAACLAELVGVPEPERPPNKNAPNCSIRSVGSIGRVTTSWGSPWRGRAAVVASGVGRGYTPGMTEITQVLQLAARGDARAAKDLLPLVYDDLRRLAAQKMAREPPGHTLTPTSLVHEAYLRIAGEAGRDWANQKHFF